MLQPPPAQQDQIDYGPRKLPRETGTDKGKGSDYGWVRTAHGWLWKLRSALFRFDCVQYANHASADTSQAVLIQCRSPISCMRQQNAKHKHTEHKNASDK